MTRPNYERCWMSRILLELLRMIWASEREGIHPIAFAENQKDPLAIQKGIAVRYAGLGQARATRQIHPHAKGVPDTRNNWGVTDGA